MRKRSHGCLDRAAATIAAGLTAGALLLPAWGQVRPGRQSNGGVLLPTGQRITPAGTQLVLNSLPMAAELSPDGRHLLVLQAGYETPSLTVIDTSAMTTLHRIELPDAWLGLTFNHRGDKVFVSGGARGSVWELAFRDGRLEFDREFPIARRSAGDTVAMIGDVRLDPDDRMLYALDLFRNRIIVLNTQSGLTLAEFRSGEAPYRARLTPDGEHLVVSHWGEAFLGVYRLSERRLVERIAVGQHPADLLIVPGEVEAPGSGFEDSNERLFAARLFVTCAHSDNLWTFGITDRNRFELLDVLPVAPRPGSPLGSLPSALGRSSDAAELYVANAGNNTILVADIQEAFPELSGVVPTGWFPTAVLGLADGGLAYLSGKGDTEHGGLAGVLPALNDEQLAFLTSAAVANLREPARVGVPPPAAVRRVIVVFSDARGPAWRRLRRESVFLSGYVPAARGEVGQLAWLTSAMETDFFVKLGPAVASGRVGETDLGAAGKAALPVAGTLWSNAADASETSETYGIAGGPPLDVLVHKVDSASELARLTVIRIRGLPDEQDMALSRLMSALEAHPNYSSTVAFVVPVSGADGVMVSGATKAGISVSRDFVSAAALLRTIEWLLGLRPMTQFDQAARPLTELFTRDP